MATKETSIEASALWERFQIEARRRRRNPARLMADDMRECLEIWEDEKLHEGICADVQRYMRDKGLTELDAVEFVRQYRCEKREKAELSAAA